MFLVGNMGNGLLVSQERLASSHPCEPVGRTVYSEDGAIGTRDIEWFPYVIGCEVKVVYCTADMVKFQLTVPAVKSRIWCM